MDIKEFEEKIVDYLKECFGDRGTVLVKDVLKNNGITLKGVMVEFEGVRANPTVYLDDFYDDYLRGVDFDEICVKISETLRQSRLTKEPDLSFIGNWEGLKSRVLCKVINTKRNEELLSRVPHKKFLNLSVVFYVILKDIDSGYGTVLIDNNHIPKNIEINEETIEELYLAALDNNREQLGSCVVPIERLLLDLALEKSNMEMERVKSEIEERLAMGDILPMFVVTNAYKINGAACMLDDKFLYDMGETFDSDYYILPSSIHEVIVVPKDDPMVDAACLQDMVKTVNNTELSPGEVLSDYVYIYCKEDRKLQCIGG